MWQWRGVSKSSVYSRIARRFDDVFSNSSSLSVEVLRQQVCRRFARSPRECRGEAGCPGLFGCALLHKRRSGLVGSDLRFAPWKNDSSAACAYDGGGGLGDHRACEQSVGWRGTSTARDETAPPPMDPLRSRFRVCVDHVAQSRPDPTKPLRRASVTRHDWLTTPMSRRGWVARSVERANALRPSRSLGRRNASGAIPRGVFQPRDPPS